MNLFYGYIHNTYDGLRTAAIKGEGIGHLTIYKKGWFLKGKCEPDKYMFSNAELSKVKDISESDENIILVSP